MTNCSKSLGSEIRLRGFYKRDEFAFGEWCVSWVEDSIKPKSPMFGSIRLPAKESLLLPCGYGVIMEVLIEG